MTLATAVFAAGCFWGVQAAFDNIPGVYSTRVGYTGGTLIDPDYQTVSKGRSGHAEAVEITYDPEKVSYRELLNVFFKIHDPTTRDRQGPDIGHQYRSAIFYLNEEQKDAAVAKVMELNRSGRLSAPVVTEITAARKFYPAEDYHQDYLKKRNLKSCGITTIPTSPEHTAPDLSGNFPFSNPFGHTAVAPSQKTAAAEHTKHNFSSASPERDAAAPTQKTAAAGRPGSDFSQKTNSFAYIEKEEEKADNENFWKQKLTPEQYEVLRNRGTERPFTGKYVSFSDNGTYVCAACGNSLFSSESKFDSGCGWPSFDRALPGSVKFVPDFSLGMSRIEVVCSRCGSHLGHVFEDGPTETGDRFCINSVSMDFHPGKN